VSVDWWDETLFFVPGPTAAGELEAGGIARGRIWDKSELLDLVLAEVTPEDAQRIAAAKLAFGAGPVVVRRERKP
jgi:hypothetical protein